MKPSTFISIPSVFTPSECDALVAHAQSLPSARAQVINTRRPSRLSLYRRCSVTWLPPGPHTDHVYMRLWQHALALNPTLWNFDLQTIRSLQYLDYGPLNYFARHIDNGSPSVSRRLLSISVQLSPPTDFVGGKLRIWGTSPSGLRHALSDQGSITIFPSHLWHQANPVWWGHRRSLIAWVESDD